MRLSFSGYVRALAWIVAASAALIHLYVPPSAAAFCGFYVTGADANLYANATMVVLMRDGTRTVLSMQNNYQGPPDEFALVIPVPTVLQKEQVKVLPNDVFTRVDQLGAPRLVEYWEQDPCWRPPPTTPGAVASAASSVPGETAAGASAPAPVRVEARFAVGEYDVVILSADDSSALDSWLRDNSYNIPEGAAPVLAPYVAAGMKFFVAKVDPARVTFHGDQAALSPLRFHYDTPEFSLPVRLGLLNSQGSQDLIVNILATERYELSNYRNLTIPTNIRVHDEVRDDFASFYEALFARTIEQTPKAVVTEYSWSAGSCDPCPIPPLSAQDIATLGADVLQDSVSQGTTPVTSGFSSPWQFTLTRLHARYTKDSLGEDLIFQPADGIMGGRGMPDQKGRLEQAVQSASGAYNNFQGRYVILHPWEKALTCDNPQRGRWGGPPTGASPLAQAPANAALSGGAAPAGDLPALLAESLPALSVTADKPLDPLPGLPISSGTLPGAGIQTQPPHAGAAVGGRSGGTATRRSPVVSGQPSAPGATAQDSISRPSESGQGGMCSAAPGRSAGLLSPLALLAALTAFGARAGRRSGTRGRRHV